MKNLVLIIFILLTFTANAQLSVQEYRTRSKKINELVAGRNSMFNQYQNGLEKKSGIFGGKTKKDMERSIDLLAQTVQADNQIILETQSLLRYKPVEQKTESKKESTSNLKSYQDSIGALQQSNSMLAQRAISLQKEKKNYTIIMLLLGLTGLALLLTAFKKGK